MKHLSKRVYSHPLVSFLYGLMRDSVPPGEVYKQVLDANDIKCQYTNGPLADMAAAFARQLGVVVEEGENVPTDE